MHERQGGNVTKSGAEHLLSCALTVTQLIASRDTPEDELPMCVLGAARAREDRRDLRLADASMRGGAQDVTRAIPSQPRPTHTRVPKSSKCSLAQPTNSSSLATERAPSLFKALLYV